MTRTVQHDSENDEPAFEQFRLTISNDVLVTAVNELHRETGMSNKEIAREAIIEYLEEKEKIQLR